MRKLLITTRVNNYFPELCSLTMPNLQAYADRVGADFIEITDRFLHREINDYIYNPFIEDSRLDIHPACEKLQAYNYSKDYDKTILIDADIVLHPLCPDLFEQINEHGVYFRMRYNIMDLPNWEIWDWRGNEYFERDGRNCGIVGSLVGWTKYTRDIVEPWPYFRGYDLKRKQDTIFRPAIIDEYVMSENMAKYGLKDYPLIVPPQMIYHAEMTTKNPKVEDVIKAVKEKLEEWS